jgi:COP9 signalosome complex subunit 4
VFVKIAECYLAENDSIGAEAAVQKAGGIIDLIPNPEQNFALMLRYKTAYARVLDANQKFLQAAGRYLELSHVNSLGDIVDTIDLLLMLGKASTCVILAPINAQRQRMLGQIFRDERLLHLERIKKFKYHITVLKKMHSKHIIKRDNDLINFENSLSDHHKIIMADGLTIIQRAVVEHNVVAMSELYSSIYFSQLERFIGVSPKHAEEIVSEMITDGRIHGSIDQVDCILYFDKKQLALIEWDDAIVGFCSRLNDIVDTIKLDLR